MIIVNDKPGQLCNRLWAYSFFIAYALKQKITIYIPYFREYQSVFQNLSSSPHINFNIIEKPRIIDILSFHTYRALTKVLRIISSWFDLHFLGIYLDPYHWTRESWYSIDTEKENHYFSGLMVSSKRCCRIARI